MRLTRLLCLLLAFGLAMFALPFIQEMRIILPACYSCEGLAIWGFLALVLVAMIKSDGDKQKALTYAVVGAIVFLCYHFARPMLPPSLDFFG